MTTLLTIHIVGAAATAALVLLSLGAILSSKGNLKFLRRGILTLGFFQIGTGALLITFSPEISLARVCLVSLAYLGAVAGVEYGLRRQIRRIAALN